MESNSKFKGWALVLNSVKAPLGFFTLLALVADGSCVIIGGVRNSQLVICLAIGVLVLLIFCISWISWRKPLALYHPADWPIHSITVNLQFSDGIEPINVDFDLDRCVLEIRDAYGHTKREGRPSLALGMGGWTFELTYDVEPSDTVNLKLIERNGRKWEVCSFRPYTTMQMAYVTRNDNN